MGQVHISICVMQTHSFRDDVNRSMDLTVLMPRDADETILRALECQRAPNPGDRQNLLVFDPVLDILLLQEVGRHDLSDGAHGRHKDASHVQVGR
jgi:hypothetical protein